MFADVGDDGVDVGEGVTEDECVVHIYDDICGLSRGYPIEKTVVERGHFVPFGKECLLVVEIEDAAGVWESVQGVCDAVFLSRVQAAYFCDMGFDGCDDPVGVDGQRGVKICGFDIHRGHVKLLDYCELEKEGECDGHDSGAVGCRQWDGGLDHCAAEGVTTCCGAGLVLVWFAVGFLLAFALEGSADTPHSAVAVVLAVSGQGLGDWYEGLGLVDETVNLLLNGDSELGTVRRLQGVGGLDLLRVAGVVFRCEEGVDGVRAHDVRVRGATVIVRVEYGWRRVLPVHNRADGRCDCADVVRLVEGGLGAVGGVTAECLWWWDGE